MKKQTLLKSILLIILLIVLATDIYAICQVRGFVFDINGNPAPNMTKVNVTIAGIGTTSTTTGPGLPTNFYAAVFGSCTASGQAVTIIAWNSTYYGVESGTQSSGVLNKNLTENLTWPDTIPPSINLSSPDNNSVQSISAGLFKQVDFFFNVTDNVGIANCTLLLNGTANKTSTSIAQGENTISVNLSKGIWTWNVNCSDSSSNTVKADSDWILTITAQNNPPYFSVNTTDSSNQTNPTNLGNNVTFRATGTDADSNPYQLIICSSPIINQSGYCQDGLICSSALTSSGSQASCSYNTSSNTALTYPWWSFVCDSNNCSSYYNDSSPYYMNYPPNMTAEIPGFAWPEDTSVSFNVSQYFSDINGNFLGFVASIVNNITVTINNATGNVTFIPQVNFSGIRFLTITAFDPFGMFNISNQFFLNVTQVNDAPSIGSCTNPSVTEDTAPLNRLVNLSLCTSDIDNATSQLTWQVQSQTNSTLINCYISESFYLNCSVPAANQSGINQINVSVFDGQYTAYTLITVSVLQANDPPYWLSALPNLTIPEDSGLQQVINLSQFAADPDNLTSQLAYIISSENTAQLDCGISGVFLTVTPAANWTGNNTLLAQCGIKIFDGQLNSSASIAYINVTPINDIPYLSSIILNQTTGKSGTSISVTTAGAGDIDSASYYLQCGNASGEYNLCAGSLVAKPSQATCEFISVWTDNSNHTAYCVLNDTLNISAEKKVNFTSDNSPPSANSINNLEGDTAPKYWDSSNNGHTLLQLNLAEANETCRWDFSNLSYSAMNSTGYHECTVVGTIASCELNVTQQANETVRYVSCQDQYGNDQAAGQNTAISFGIDWSIPDVFSSNDGQIHLPGYIVNFTMQDQPVGTIVTSFYCNDSSGACQPSIQWIGTNGSQASLTFSQRGTWYLRWNATDDAGNFNATNRTKQTVVFINTLPLIGSQSYVNTTPHRFTVSSSVSDSVGSSQGPNFNCTLYHKTGASAYSTKLMTLISGTATSGVYSANISIADSYSVFAGIDTYVNCTDGMEWNISSASSNGVPNTKPTAPSVFITPHAPLISDNLFCNITSNSTDADSDPIAYSYSWYKNSISQNINVALLLAGNLSFNDVWNCTVIPFDSYENGSFGSDKVSVGNSPPVFNPGNPIPDMTWPEDTLSSTLNLSNYFTDPNGDSMAFFYSPNPVSNIAVQINQTSGIVTFTPSANFTGIRTIQFNATDSLLWSSYSNLVTLNVTPVNDLPYFPALLSTIVLQEDSFNASINLSKYVADIDNTLQDINWSASQTQNVTIVINNLTKMINVSAALHWFGNETVIFTAFDGTNSSSMPQTKAIVLEINYPPQANFTALSGYSIHEDSYTQNYNASENLINLSLYVSDIETLSSGINWACITNNSNVIAIASNITKQLNVTSKSNFTGTANVTCTAFDAQNSQSTGSFRLNVINVNDAPFFNPRPLSFTLDEGVMFSYDANATDIDPTNDVLTYYSNSTLFTINSTTGYLNFTPNSTQIGVYSINFTVCDDKGACDTSIATLTVQNAQNDIIFYVSDRINGVPLDTVTITGGTVCAAGCVFDYNITIANEPNGPANYTITKTGFSTNITRTNITGDMTFNITLNDISLPNIDSVNITSRLSANTSGFYIDVKIDASDNMVVSNISFNYTFSQGYDESGLILLNNINGTRFEGILGPYNFTRAIMNSSEIAVDGYGNFQSKTNDPSWFMFMGGNATFVYTTTTDISPVVIITSPENSSIDLDGNMTLIYGAYDESNVTNCSLYGNFTGTFSLNQTDLAIENNIANLFYVNNLGNGTYRWNVGCYDNSSHYTVSQTYLFIVNITGQAVIVQSNASNATPNKAPKINITIPDQRKQSGQSVWTLNLTPYASDEDTALDNLTWSVLGINPLFMNITIDQSTDLATFSAKFNSSGVDKVTFVVKDNTNLSDQQEITVSVNKTLEFRQGWNLFSVPYLENNSVTYILAQIGNGNFGCGHDDSPPYDCKAADGDFAGNWTILWTQNSTGSWIYFRPDVYYPYISTQSVQTMDVGKGYWISMSTAQNITLNYG